MVLVTGGAGFIGSHIVDALVAAGERVRVLDALLPAAHQRRPDYLNPQAEFVHGDVSDPRTVARALGGVGAVCHQAAMVGLGQNVSTSPTTSATTISAPQRCCGSWPPAASPGGSCWPAAWSSTARAATGAPSTARCGAAPRAVSDLRAGRFEPGCPACGAELQPVAVDESAPLDPRNVYAATKLQQEHLCFAFARETGIPVTALRYHNVYGPRMPRDTPYAGVAAIFASALAAGRTPRVFEDGGQRRDFVHVRDVARANLAALLREAPLPGAFNVASGTPHTVGEMARALAAASGGHAPAPVITGEFRRGDVRHVFASARRAEHELGFSAQEGFEAGMAEFSSAPLRAA